MKTLILILTMFCLISCSTDDENQFIQDVSFELSVKDNQGNDLLDPGNPDSFAENKIKLFYMIDENILEVYNENMDYPRNFFIFKHKNSFRMRIFLNSSETDLFSETVIQWDENDKDTIKSEMYRTNSLVKIVKIWLNNELIWTNNYNSEKYYELTK